jgi:anti-sigma regulatory factor (Ser/Thr protein kinase)
MSRCGAKAEVSVCWRRRHDATCEKTAIGEVRRFVRSCIHDVFRTHDAHELVGDAELVVSELAANSVNADCDHVEVSVTVHDQWLEISVQDDAAGTPTMRPPTPHAACGRGLRIVAALSSDWGVIPVAGGGKTVWSRLAVPRDLPAQPRCRRPGPPSRPAAA